MHEKTANLADGSQEDADPVVAALRRSARREKTLQTALQKRAAGVPTYTVPEAAALLSVSHEHLYRLIRADAFPALDMRRRRDQGRYVVPARAVEEMLDAATENAALVKTLGFRSAGGVA